MVRKIVSHAAWCVRIAGVGLISCVHQRAFPGFTNSINDNKLHRLFFIIV